MPELLHQTIAVFELARDWLLAQPLPVQIVAGVVGLAVLWVLRIILRVILVAFRAAFRGL